MNQILARWNALPPDEAATEILSCCGSRAWAANLAARRPFADEQTLFTAADDCWRFFRQSENHLVAAAIELIGQRLARIEEHGVRAQLLTSLSHRLVYGFCEVRFDTHLVALRHPITPRERTFTHHLNHDTHVTKMRTH